MSQAQKLSFERMVATLESAVALQDAIEQGDAMLALDFAASIMAISPEFITANATEEELAARSIAQGSITRFLIEMVFSDDLKWGFWKDLMLPDAHGNMARHLWIDNAKWMRHFGVPLGGACQLDLNHLEGLGFTQQAKYLGRFCSTNDGEVEIDFTGIAQRLDSRLLPYFVSWTLGTYMLSPNALAGPEAAANQAKAMSEYLEFQKLQSDPLPCSLNETT
ncbi:MAG: hypothetical protein KDB61_14960, partial [Planctomycetes bacterium]|nr:hypothetical protein [Planctomycetota bacterium]